MALLAVAECGIHRQGQRAVVIGFAARIVAALEPEPSVVGLQMNRNVMHVWRDAFRAFAVDNLQFRIQVEPWDGGLPAGEQVFRLAYDRNGQRSTLLSLPTFVNSFLGTIDTNNRNSRPGHPLTFPYAFRRGSALSRQGMARGVRPLRFGDPLVESLSAFCDYDDRGRSFAMWRHLPGHEARDASGIDLYFRFDLHVEAGSLASAASDDADTRALRRRASGMFPPQCHTLWVSIDGAINDEPPPADLLAARRVNVPGTRRTGRVSE